MHRVRSDRTFIGTPNYRAQLSEAQRDAWEFMLILRAAAKADPATSVFTTAKLRETTGGKVEYDDSHARDIQFELYVPALFANAGFEITRGDPDSRLTHLGESLGIEAKRAHSTNADTLRSAISEAARQITGKVEASTIQVIRSRGFIAVNLDVYFRVH